MQGHMSPQPTKGQLLEIDFQGRTYKICSKGQMNFIMAMAVQKIQTKAAEEGRQLSDEDMKKEMEEYKENCGYAVLSELLAKVSPEERQRWETNYRFAGISRKSPR